MKAPGRSLIGRSTVLISPSPSPTLMGVFEGQINLYYEAALEKAARRRRATREHLQVF